jgi:hypothetical protein
MVVGEWDEEDGGVNDGSDDGGGEYGGGGVGGWGVCADENGVISSGSPMPNSSSMVGFLLVTTLCKYLVP